MHRRGDLPSEIAFLDRALALLEPDDGARAELLPALGRGAVRGRQPRPRRGGGGRRRLAGRDRPRAGPLAWGGRARTPARVPTSGVGRSRRLARRRRARRDGARGARGRARRRAGALPDVRAALAAGRDRSARCATRARSCDWPASPRTPSSSMPASATSPGRSSSIARRCPSRARSARCSCARSAGVATPSSACAASPRCWTPWRAASTPRGRSSPGHAPAWPTSGCSRPRSGWPCSTPTPRCWPATRPPRRPRSTTPSASRTTSATAGSSRRSWSTARTCCSPTSGSRTRPRRRSPGSRSVPAPNDAEWVIKRHAARGKLAAREGDAERALSEARAAVELADATEHVPVPRRCRAGSRRGRAARRRPRGGGAGARGRARALSRQGQRRRRRSALGVGSPSR